MYDDDNNRDTVDPFDRANSSQDEREYRDYRRRSPQPIKPKKPKLGIGSLILALLIGFVGGFFGGGLGQKYFFKEPAVEEAGADASKISIETSEDLGQVEGVAHKVMPSVVGITTQGTKMTILGPMAVQGSGSGFIVTKDGYIVSNAHVIGKMGSDVTVLLNDGSEVQGKTVWSDETLDLGLVKVERTDLPAVELGDSDNVNIGELAIAIGNPMGLDFQRSVTAGVISGLNRSLGEVEGNYMEGLIQTDASINRGNSGGPLLNKKGEVIGINSVKLASGEGMGFSIPVNTVKPIIEQVIETGEYKSVNLGITGSSVEAVERQYNVDLATDHKGVLVHEVVEGSPAAEANLQSGDIILKFGDREISSMSELRRDLYNYKSGDTVDITVVRKGEKKDLELTFTDFEVTQQDLPNIIVEGEE